jgi:hypothetical protein
MTPDGVKEIINLAPQVQQESKDLVIFGSNLTSTVGVKYNRTQLAMVKLPSHIQGIMVGLILSDGCLSFNVRWAKNALLKFSQSLAHFEYLWFVFNLLSHYCSSYPQLITATFAGKSFYGLQFRTRSMPCLTELHPLFYVNKVKVIPHNIYELLTPIALAHWIMRDGTNEKGGLILCTDSFSLKDVVRLMNVLIIRYGLNCTLRYFGQYPRIYIRRDSMANIQRIVEPFIHPSMMYKLYNIT